MILLVCGGRDYTDFQKIFNVLDEFHAQYGIERIIEGCARGADQIAEIWADKNGIPLDHNPANWAKYGKAAGPLRNREMAAKNPDAVLAFPTVDLVHSRGTKDMVSVARKMGIRIEVYENT